MRTLQTDAHLCFLRLKWVRVGVAFIFAIFGIEAYAANCWYDCGVSMTPYGTWAAFTIDSPSHDSMILEVGTSAPDTDGQFSQGAALTLNLGHKQHWNTHLSGLFENTHYYYVIRLKDNDGRRTIKVDSFWTRKRMLRVKFETIHVIDDADWGAKGAGDFTFAFFIGGELVGDHVKSLHSGDNTHPNLLRRYWPQPSTQGVQLRVPALEDDGFNGPALLFDPYMWTAAFTQTQAQGAYDYGEAKTTIQFGPFAPTEKQCGEGEIINGVKCALDYSPAFSMKTRGDGEAKYEVFGRYWVFYEPNNKAPKDLSKWQPKIDPAVLGKRPLVSLPKAKLQLLPKTEAKLQLLPKTELKNELFGKMIPDSAIRNSLKKSQVIDIGRGNAHRQQVPLVQVPMVGSKKVIGKSPKLATQINSDKHRQLFKAMSPAAEKPVEVKVKGKLIQGQPLVLSIQPSGPVTIKCVEGVCKGKQWIGTVLGTNWAIPKSWLGKPGHYQLLVSPGKSKTKVVKFDLAKKPIKPSVMKPAPTAQPPKPPQTIDTLKVQGLLPR